MCFFYFLIPKFVLKISFKNNFNYKKTKIESNMILLFFKEISIPRFDKLKYVTLKKTDESKQKKKLKNLIKKYGCN